MQPRTKTIWTTAIFATAWVGAVSLGLATLLNYASAPGRVGAVPATWPAESRIPLAATGETLVMLAHPRCPCTSASMNELAQIMAHVQGKVRAYVVFLKPQDSGADWDDTWLRRSAAEIPGVTVLSDVDGAEARRFGVETSGHTLLFDPAGHLLFNGGITESRGHAGDNTGESTIIALVNNRTVERRSTSVFGCPLFAHAQKATIAPCPNGATP